MYKYYFEGRWKRVEETDTYPITLNYSMISYKSLFKSFKYDIDNDLYYIENMMINDNNYQRIEIKFENNDIKSYKLINDKTISYEFSEYNNTRISFPDDFDIVYKKLDNEEWLKIVEDTVNHNVYDYKSVFEKSYNGVLVESESNHGQCREDIVYEILNQVEYKYVVNGDNWDFYRMDNSIYILVNSFSREMVSFSQKTKIPYKLFLDAYKEFEFNEIANSYILKNYEFEDYYYDDVVVNIIDNKIGYISLKYRQTIDNKEYNFVKVVEFTFNVNTIDEA